MRDWMKLRVSTGDVVQMDSEDVRLLNGLFVCISAGIRRAYTFANGRSTPLSRFLMRPDEGLVVDHIDGNLMDNRKSNLRVCTVSENLRNRKRNVNNLSGYKGVYKYGGEYRAKPYRAIIRCNKKKHELGYFATAEEAHEAYKAAAVELHAEFANFG